MLIAAMNPCPCGYYRDTLKECRCAPHEVLRYQKKISGPLLDRIDIQITVPRVPLDELHTPTKAYAVDEVRAAVEAARAAQRRRHGRGVAYTNHELTSKEIEEYGALSANARALMLTLSEKALISARGYYRILKVARTIADLAGRESVEKEDVIEAFSYRLREDREAA
jgi:magnesium chelatase family protein